MRRFDCRAAITIAAAAIATDALRLFLYVMRGRDRVMRLFSIRCTCLRDMLRAVLLPPARHALLLRLLPLSAVSPLRFATLAIRFAADFIAALILRLRDDAALPPLILFDAAIATCLPLIGDCLSHIAMFDVSS